MMLVRRFICWLLGHERKRQVMGVDASGRFVFWCGRCQRATGRVAQTHGAFRVGR